MKHIFYLIILLLCVPVNGQETNAPEHFKVEIITLEKNSKDILAGSIIEIFSGGERIEYDMSDFDGISIFYLNLEDIEDKKITLKVYSLKCKPLKKEINLDKDLKRIIYPKYGKTFYNHPSQLSEMFEKFNLKPKLTECGTID